MPVENKSVEDLQNEYKQACLDAGNLAYQIEVFQEELNRLYSCMREINNAGAALRQKQEEGKE